MNFLCKVDKVIVRHDYYFVDFTQKVHFADAPIMNFLCKVDKVIVMSVDTRKIHLLFIYVRLRDSLYDN